MSTVKIQQRDRKYKKVPNRNHRDKEYNNWTEKYTRRFQQQTRWSKKWITDLEDKAVNLTQTEQEKKKKSKAKITYGTYRTILSRMIFTL